MAQQILAAKVMINPLRRIRTAPALFDLGKSSVEASISPNVVDENTTFTRLGQYIPVSPVKTSRKSISTHKGSAPIHIPKFNQPLALEESGGKKKSFSIEIDRTVGYQSANNIQDTLFQFDDLS